MKHNIRLFNLPALLLLFACVLDTVTERRLSGRRAGVAGGESWLKALAIMRVAAEEQNKRLLQSYFLSLYALLYQRGERRMGFTLSQNIKRVNRKMCSSEGDKY